MKTIRKTDVGEIWQRKFLKCRNLGSINLCITFSSNEYTNIHLLETLVESYGIDKVQNVLILDVKIPFFGGTQICKGNVSGFSTY
jgi:hypothetical protein